MTENTNKSLDTTDGLGQAIEDVAALATVFPKGTAPSDVPERLKLYEKLRQERAYRIQAYAKRAGENSWEGRNEAEGEMSQAFNCGVLAKEESYCLSAL